MELDILITNARTRLSEDDLLDIGIHDGRVIKIGQISNARAVSTIDAGSRLVTESFVNGHLHLCKVYTLTMAGEDALGAYTSGTMGAAMEAIEQASRVKEHYDES